MADILDIQGLNLSFGGLQALIDVSMKVEEGKVCALIGPNGAGKSTIFNCISRFYSPDSGDILFKGQSVLGYKPYQIAALGIGRTFQNLELFELMTVLDNILLGYHLHKPQSLLKSMFFTKGLKKNELEIRSMAEQIIDLLDLQPYREALVTNIPYGVKKRVELARALATRPKLLLLDEPAAGLNSEEKEDLAWWILDIKEELNVTVLVIEHDMGFVMKLSDSVVCIDHGALIIQGKPADVQKHPDVIAAYMGKGETNAKA